MTHVVGKTAPSSQRLKQLSQYASSPGHGSYYYAELAVFYPNSGRKSIASTHYAYPRRDGQAELTLVAGYSYRFSRTGS